MSLEAQVALGLGDLDLDVELRAADDEVVAVLGPNGAGKSTLLRALAGLQPVDRGRIAVDGQVLDDPASGRWVPPEGRSVGVVFQDYLLFPHLTALENVAFGPRARGRVDPAATARRWLERVGLAEQAGLRPRQLSGGQAQRVALARALAAEPRLLLLDEPLSALDAGARAEVRRELRRHLSELSAIRILVTHDPVDALALADRLVIVERGRITQSGRADEVTARPRSRYVAELVGMNLWRGRAEGREVRVGDAVVTVAEPATGEVFATVHPRAVALFKTRPEGTPRNVWRGRPLEVDREGERARVRLSGPVPVIAEVTPAAVRELDLEAGGEVWVAIKATEVQVYPA